MRSHCSLQTPKGTLAGRMLQVAGWLRPLILSPSQSCWSSHHHHHHCHRDGVGRARERRTARATSKWQDPHASPLCVAKGLWIGRVVLS